MTNPKTNQKNDQKTEKPVIKIGVACHKPSELPENSLFLPVQVGAALAKKPLQGVTPDNQGEHISQKNPSYCELTAQYYLWKNVEADFYGLCHYRRYLCFKKNPAARRNNRGQIEAGMLNAFNLERFGLEDEAEMRRLIEKSDAITGEYQQVNRLYTPRGAQSTAYKHWVAHDRALIKQADLDRMLEILSEVSPEVGRAAREHLNSGQFLGFNCFVLKKELFNELCEIEFKTLERLEKEVEVDDTYGSQLSRIFGFMGEIISSAYFYYLEQTGRKVRHLPLVYFNHTDPAEDYAPLKDAIPVLFNHAENNPFRFGVIWQSFLNYIDKTRKYDVILFASLTPELKQTFQEMAAPHKNVSLRFLDSSAYKAGLTDRFKLRNTNTYKDPADLSDHLSALPFFPFILKNYQKMLVFDENILIADSIAGLWDEYSGVKEMIAAPPSIYMRARINDIYFETAERYLRTQMKEPLSYFSINTFIWDFQQYREAFSEKQIAKLCRPPQDAKRLRHKEEVMNILCEENVLELPLRWNTWYETNDHLTYQLPYAPNRLYKELKSAQQAPGVISYIFNEPWDPGQNGLSKRFWAAARQTTFYEECLDYGTLLLIERAKHTKGNLLLRLFPVDGKMRARLTRLFPYDATRTRTVKKALEVLHLR